MARETLKVTIKGRLWEINEFDPFELQARPVGESMWMCSISGGHNDLEKYRKIARIIQDHPDYK